jgi:serine phosphatase RsbU (regulator of sigma subunit)
MLVRERRVSLFECVPTVPVGVASQFPLLRRAEVCSMPLQPGDRVLLYSDGCVEAAMPSGEPFGEERLGDFLVREQSAGLGLAETVRRLSHAVIDHAGGAVQDDATLALIEYRGRD